MIARQGWLTNDTRIWRVNIFSKLRYTKPGEHPKYESCFCLLYAMWTRMKQKEHDWRLFGNNWLERFLVRQVMKTRLCCWFFVGLYKPGVHSKHWKLFQYMFDDANRMSAKGNLTSWRAWFNARWTFSARLWTLCSKAKDINSIMELLATGYDRKYSFVSLWEKLNAFDRFMVNVKRCRIFEDDEWRTLERTKSTLLRRSYEWYEWCTKAFTWNGVLFVQLITI